jgi:hypothetical protein
MTLPVISIDPLPLGSIARIDRKHIETSSITDIAMRYRSYTGNGTAMQRAFLLIVCRGSQPYSNLVIASGAC